MPASDQIPPPASASEASAPETSASEASAPEASLRDAAAGVARARSRLPSWRARLAIVAARQASAALFGLILLAAMALSRLAWPEDAALARNDALLAFCLIAQAVLILSRLERPREVAVIAVFHAVGTLMELYKTGVGSWSYPGGGVFTVGPWALTPEFVVGPAPLFTGFMYAAVGSYLARAWRLHDARFEGYPPVWATAALAAAIYLNFFTHHVAPDMRLVLFAATIWLFWRTRASLELAPGLRVRAPLLALFLAVGLALWGAENVATWSRVWLYPHQLEAWSMVKPAKIGSWSLLMIVSFVLVSLLHRPDRGGPAARVGEGARG